VALLPGLREHFGYRDGISQPAIAGSGLPVLPGHAPVLRAGEFILGTLDQNNEYPAAPQPAALGRNGTYLVWRKLHEDVAGFRAFLQQNAATPDAEERLAAKLMGRWRSGAPLALSPDQDDPTLGADARRNNAFQYLAEDAKGLTCPLGSHVRRAYARDALNGPITDVQRHRVLRRGMPYGPPLPPGAPDDQADRGLIFVALGASIARQFEFVQSVWLNNSDFIGQSGDRDPIAGANDETTNAVIPQKPLRRRILGIPRFVTVRGGGYFFLPGVQALHLLARE
jgi:Dyp-type peroxidase family